MADKFVIADMGEALRQRSFPTITLWNRLEGRPRTADFKRALKAEVRDALWMLTRQWQMGEFRGDDAGSPVFAKLHTGQTRLDRFKPSVHPAQSFDGATPLEATVEHRAIQFTLDLRLLMGRQWLKLIKGLGDYAAAFIDQYPIRVPDPTSPADAPICAHEEVWQSFAAVAGRRMDGAGLYLHLKANPANHAYDSVNIDPTHENEIDQLAKRFVKWFENLYYQPGKAEGDAWESDRLEYRFACSAPVTDGEKVYTAEEYYHGHLDWYNFDIDGSSKGLGETGGTPALPTTVTRSLIPTPVVYEGMPNTRWWAFEDRKTNFGDVKPDTTDLAKLLLIEFGLVYANDWFLIPSTAQEGSIIDIRGLAVTNVFGERFWIEAAGSGPDDAWQRWSIFTISTKGKAGEAADTSLMVLPTVPKIQQSPPLEEVLLIRDEVANMVWGIEKTIPAPTGEGKPGGEAAIETLNYFKRLSEFNPSPPLPPGLLKNEAKIRYEVMNTVPENWIPFIPVHVPGDNRRIQLQRASMPRLLPDGTVTPVKPRTVLLREGLDQSTPKSYFIHEEEVPRAGVRVTRTYQRTRWHNGGVFVWLGVRKQTGRGEGSSGLAFDRIVDIESSETRDRGA
jgi:hypothetical protein